MLRYPGTETLRCPKTRITMKCLGAGVPEGEVEIPNGGVVDKGEP
jgi:hypothetical protein